MDQLTPSLLLLLESFRPCFRTEVFVMFRTMTAAWIVCLGRRTVSRVWETTGRSADQDHSAAFRLFSQAAWNWDELCRILLLLLIEKFVPGMRVWLAVDDTLCHKRGAKVAFGGIFLDPVLSSKKHKNFRFGHNWVTMALIVRLPFRPDRYYALPILWRLCRKKDKQAPHTHRTKAQLAAEMVQTAARWLPSHTITLLADDAYMGKSLLGGLPENVQAIGPLRWDAALFAAPDEQAHGNRKKGKRLSTPKELLADDGQHPAHTVTVELLQQTKTLEVKRLSGVLWYGVTGARPVQVVLVRDPEGAWRNEALVSTDLSLDAAAVITEYCRRWAIELSYHDSKQFLGLHDPQVWCERAVERAAPMAWFLSSLVILWYATEGQDCPAAHRHRPWYQQKKWPTFADMLATCRLSLWRHWQAEGSADSADSACDAEWTEKVDWLIEYLSTAA